MSFKIKAIAATAAVALSLGTLSSAQAAKRLVSPNADWTGGVVTCKVLYWILENEMDYKIKQITMPSGPGVMEGIRAGDLDFACESWPSYSTTKDKYMTKWGGDGSVAYLGETGVVGVSGYWVPRYMVEGDSARGIEATAPNLKSYEDLNQYKDLFKSLESGDRGNLIGCPVAAWQCEDQQRLDLLGVDFHAQALGSETAHWAELQAKYKRGEPFLAYAWAPHWIFAAMDLVEVALPPHDEEKWPATNWAKDITYNYGKPSLEQDHPEVFKLIMNQNLTNNQQAQMIYEVDVNKRDIDEVVDEWMAANKDIWAQWLP